jgi:t-SNARE complex subunit (syntaxin)
LLELVESVKVSFDHSYHDEYVVKGFGGEKNGSFEEFNKMVDKAKQQIKSMNDKAARLKNLKNDLFMPKQEKIELSLSQEIENLVILGNKNARDIQSLIKVLIRDFRTLEETATKNQKSEVSTRRIRLEELVKQYMRDLREYQNIQNQIKEIKSKRAEKQILQVKPDATPEEIDAVIRTGQVSQLVKHNILEVEIIA